MGHAAPSRKDLVSQENSLAALSGDTRLKCKWTPHQTSTVSHPGCHLDSWVRAAAMAWVPGSLRFQKPRGHYSTSKLAAPEPRVQATSIIRTVISLLPTLSRPEWKSRGWAVEDNGFLVKGTCVCNSGWGQKKLRAVGSGGENTHLSLPSP